MAGEWVEISLAAVMDVKHGFAFPGENIRDEPPGDILLTPGNIAIGGGFKGDKFKYFDGEVPADYVLSEGDLVVTMTDLSKQADTLGYPAIVPKPSCRRFLHNQRLGKVLIKNGAELDKGYLYYLLRTTDYRHEVLASATGTTVKHTSPGRILSYKASIPPLAEQKAIAAVLGALDDKIELNRRMNATLEAMARALFQSWYVDFDPVRAKLDGREPVGLDTATAALFPASFQDSEVGSIPKGWEVAKLKDLTSKIGSGATPRGGSEVYVEEGPALIRSQNVYDYEFRWAGLARLTDKSAEELKNVEVMKNDVLLNITGDSILRTCVVDPEALPARVNQYVAIIRAINGIPANYLHFYLVQESMKTFLIGMSAGATRHAITKGHLESIDVLKPSALVLKAFEQRTTPWFAQIDANRSQSRTLATLRDMLLPKLLSGELKAEGFTV
jgi:type I restriction enzyme S subunit